MSKKKRIIIICIMILLILCIGLSIIGILSSSKEEPAEPKEPEIPKITEDFKEVELVSKYMSTGSIYFNEESNEIIEYVDSNRYLIGSNGVLNSEKVLKTDNDDPSLKDYPLAESKNYKFYIDENGYCYYINTKNKKKSKSYYDIILPYKGELTGVYAILVTYDDKTDERTYEVLNTNNGSIKKIDVIDATIENDQSISHREMEPVYSSTVNYFTITNKTNKVGLINPNGDIVIDIIYDNISVFEDKYIIASLDNKYGIVNFKNEEVIPFEYDNIYSVGNFLILEKNKKLSIANSNAKIYIDSKIDTTTDNREFDTMGYYFKSTVYNNKLYLVVYYNNKTSIYLINSKDIERKVSTSTYFEILQSYNKNTKYFYTIEQNNDKETITLYDYDLYEYFKTEVDVNKNIKHNTEVKPLQNNPNYYSINIYTELGTIGDKTYYIDLFNSKKIDEYTALKRYFKNGYNFYISTDNKLKVYKDSTMLNEFEGEYEYLGGYLFLKENEIFELTFKKDSTKR